DCCTHRCEKRRGKVPFREVLAHNYALTGYEGACSDTDNGSDLIDVPQGTLFQEGMKTHLINPGIAY
ncbi:MAG: hypothetical protein M0P17_12660, partial [Methanoculleus sp.]|nr:hypothetical protein [Methanoculleus sp.]